VRQELAPHGKSAQRIRVQEIREIHGSACGPVIVPVFKFWLSDCFQTVKEWQSGCVYR
jgi:hypothetical protein